MLTNFAQKAYEICYAIFRLGDGIKNTDLKNRLEKASLDVLEASSLTDNYSLARSISLLEILVIFSQGIGEINYLQAQVLLREIGNFNTAIRQSNSAIAELNLDEFFSTHLPIQTKESKKSNSKSETPAVLYKTNQPLSNIEQPVFSSLISSEINQKQEEAITPDKEKENAAMRQSAIVDIMRQVQDCRIKDLIAAFPGVSERTLRYDLQKLCEEGIIERVGPGGPGTYYHLKSVTSN